MVVLLKNTGGAHYDAFIFVLSFYIALWVVESRNAAIILLCHYSYRDVMTL